MKDRCWTEIDLSALRENYALLKSRLPAGCRLMSIVKADGYGHGAVAAAKALEDDKEGWLGVACLEEALALRRAGIQKPILILGYTNPAHAETLASQKITQSLLSHEYAAALAAAARRAHVHVPAHAALDTGMSRIGYLAYGEAYSKTVRQVAEAYRCPELEVSGIFTHFSSAYENKIGRAHV